MVDQSIFITSLINIPIVLFLSMLGHILMSGLQDNSIALLGKLSMIYIAALGWTLLF